MQLRKKDVQAVEMQMGPMIDMTFLLLIFFMVTTKISKDQVKVDIKLPTAANATIPNDISNRDIISIDGTGAYYIGQTPATKKELTAHLKERFKITPPLRLYIRADKNTPGKQIKELMRIAAEAGAVNVIFGTYQD